MQGTHKSHSRSSAYVASDPQDAMPANRPASYAPGSVNIIPTTLLAEFRDKGFTNEAAKKLCVEGAVHGAWPNLQLSLPPGRQLSFLVRNVAQGRESDI